jgi:iron-sulfur cluster repair protein YtfE (RIC family)
LNYTISDDVCNTYIVTYQKLEEFEDDLHKHAYLGDKTRNESLSVSKR